MQAGGASNAHAPSTSMYNPTSRIVTFSSAIIVESSERE